MNLVQDLFICLLSFLPKQLHLTTIAQWGVDRCTKRQSETQRDNGTKEKWNGRGDVDGQRQTGEKDRQAEKGQSQHGRSNDSALPKRHQRFNFLVAFSGSGRDVTNIVFSASITKTNTHHPTKAPHTHTSRLCSTYPSFLVQTDNLALSFPW